jgi:GT2 family glycosyltransferase
MRSTTAVTGRYPGAMAVSSPCGADATRANHVDIVILTWNDGPLLRRAVDSALNSEGCAVHVVVVDNGSDPPATVDDDARIVLVRNGENRGVAPARNQGVRLGHSPYVCLLDSDAELLPDTLVRLVEPLLTDTHVALSAPVFVDQHPTAAAGMAPTPALKLARLLNRRSDYDGPPIPVDAPCWDVEFAIGACQLFRRVAFDGVAGLDESYFYGPEDVDFCLRLGEAGWRLVQVRDAACLHPPRRRNRAMLSRRGLAHGWAVTRHLYRHRERRRVH